MRMSFAMIILFGVILQAEKSLCQCGAVPKLSINASTLTVSGQAVHLSSKLPSGSEKWFYTVECHPSSRLFNFSLWTILKFADRDGFYQATAWNLQVLDSKEHPEKELLFEHENDFYFSGDVDSSSGAMRIRIDSILGLPKQLHGAISLHEVMTESKSIH